MRNQKQVNKILKEVLTILENSYLSGEIGVEGATIREIEKAVSDGRCINNDCHYHTCQLTWLKIHEALELINEKNST